MKTIEDWEDFDEFDDTALRCVNCALAICRIILGKNAFDGHCEDCAKYFGLGPHATAVDTAMRERAEMQKRFGRRLVDPRMRTSTPDHIADELFATERETPED